MINYYWRMLATGYNFLSFGVGGLLAAVTVVPLAWLWPGEQVRRDARTRQVVHYLFRYFVWQMRMTGVITVEVNDLQRLRDQAPGRVVVANHPTLIDVVLLISFVPYSCCVVKEGVWRNPVMLGVVRAAGYISNNASSEEFLERSGRALRGRFPVVVFPEGTRSVPGRAIVFQRGAANIAVRHGADVLPVVIRSEPPMLRKNERWYQIPPRRGHLSLAVHDPIPTTQWVDESRDLTLATRRFNSHLEEYFRREVGDE